MSKSEIFNLAERERFTLDTENEVLHFQRKCLGVNGQLGRARTFDHKLASSVTVKLSYTAKEVEEVVAVPGVECRLLDLHQ